MHSVKYLQLCKVNQCLYHLWCASVGIQIACKHARFPHNNQGEDKTKKQADKRVQRCDTHFVTTAHSSTASKVSWPTALWHLDCLSSSRGQGETSAVSQRAHITHTHTHTGAGRLGRGNLNTVHTRSAMPMRLGVGNTNLQTSQALITQDRKSKSSQ